MSNQSEGSYFKGAVSLLAGTIPLLAVNMAIYAGFFLAALLWFGIWGGLGLFLARFAEIAGAICFLIALGTGGWAWRMARRYLLYLVKGAHIAAMSEILSGRTVPKGPGQVAYARGIAASWRSISRTYRSSSSSTLS